MSNVEKDDPSLHRPHSVKATEPIGLVETLRSKLALFQVPEDGTRKYAPALAWLDGYRGLAAIGVFNFHYFTAYTDSIMTGYGYDPNHHRLTELPFVRVLADGGTFVNVFFVISGYVCSLNALKAMSNQDIDRALKGLSLSIFRRFLRLYLPVFAVTLITASFAQIGVFDLIRPMIDQKREYFPGAFSEVNLIRFATPSDQFAFWFAEMSDLCNPWNYLPVYPLHDPHLWTIAYEFRMSMYLYISLIGLAKCRPKSRMILLFALGMLQFVCNRWEGPLFFTGAALAQYDIIRAHRANVSTRTMMTTKRSSPSSSSSFSTLPFRSLPDPSSITENTTLIDRNIWNRFANLVRVAGYITSFYFMTYPIAGHKRPAPGYIWMTNLIPTWYNRKEKLPKTIGVLLFTYLLCIDSPVPTKYPRSTHHKTSSTVFHSLFLSAIPQIAGRYMFGLYLVHGPILHAFGYGVPHVVWNVIGNSGIAYPLGLMTGWMVNLSICFSCAVLFHRFIEPLCGKVVKKVEVFCFASE